MRTRNTRRAGIRVAGTVLCTLFSALTAVPVVAQRVTPGNFPGWYLSRLNAAPQLEVTNDEAPRWLPFNFNTAARASWITRAAMTAPQRAAWDSQAVAILTFLRRAPVFTQSYGRDFEPSVSLTTVSSEFFGAGGQRKAAFFGGLNVGAFTKREVTTTPKGTLRTTPGAHTAHFTLSFNSIPSIMPGPWMSDANGVFFALKQEGSLDGLPIYGESLVLTRNNRLPYAPVSLERAVKAFLASHLGNSKSAASAREMLASASPAARAAQAWVCDKEPRWSLEHCFVPPNSAGGVPLVAIDTTFFDPSLPRHAIQILTVNTLNNVAKGSESINKNSGFAINLAIFQQTNWKELRDTFVR